MLTRSILITFICLLYACGGGGDSLPNPNNNNNNNGNNNGTLLGSLTLSGADTALLGTQFNFNVVSVDNNGNTSNLQWGDNSCTIIINTGCILSTLVLTFSDDGSLLIVTWILADGNGVINHGYQVSCLSEDCSTINVDRANKQVVFNNFEFIPGQTNSSLATDSLFATGSISYAEEVIPDPVMNVSGRWLMSINTVPTSSCLANDTLTFAAFIQQTGSNLVIDTPFGSYNGSLSNNTIQFSGDFQLGRGVLSVSDFSATALIANSYSGSSTWALTLNNQAPCVTSMSDVAIVPNNVLAGGGSLSFAGNDVGNFNLGNFDVTSFNPYSYTNSNNGDLIVFIDNVFGSHLSQVSITPTKLTISIRLDAALDLSQTTYTYACTFPCDNVTNANDKITFTNAILLAEGVTPATEIQVNGELVKDPTKYNSIQP